MKQEEIEMKVITDPTLHQAAVGDEAAVSGNPPAALEDTPAAEKQEETGQASPADHEEHEGDQTPGVVKTLEDIVEQEAKEEATVPPSNFSLSRTLGGAIVAKAVHKQIGLVLLIAGFLIVYITCRYMCQKQMVEIDRLEQKLVTVRYKSVVFSSALTEKSRESNIMNMLEQRGDSTLKIPTEPPYKINIPE